MQNRTTRKVASILGVIAGLLGLLHGIYETLQGNVSPGGISILAKGPPCQANRVWHSCFPAVTIIPNIFVTGVLAIIVSLIIVVWAAAIVQRKYGGLVLILLSIIQFIVGGGIISPIVGFVAGMAGMGIQMPLTRWRTYLPVRLRHFLATTLWLWSLIAFLFWMVGISLLGIFFNEFVLNLARFPLYIALVLVLLVSLSGFAHDIYP